MKHILLISMPCGTGHVHASEAIASFSKQYPNLKITHLRAEDYISNFDQFFHFRFYNFIKQHVPFVWDVIYKLARTRCFSFFVRFLNDTFCTHSNKFNKKLEGINPDVIICTYFGLLSMVAPYVKEKNTPLGSVLTDFEGLPMYLHNQVSTYFVPSAEAKKDIHRFTRESECIVSGIPVNSKFFDAQKKSRDAIKRNLSLPQDKKIILVVASTYTKKEIDQCIKNLSNDYFVIAVDADSEITTRSFIKKERTDEINKYMAIADCIISKPGGLIASEIIALQKPAVFYKPIAGQEKANQAILIKSHGFVACDNLSQIKQDVLQAIQNKKQTPVKKPAAEIILDYYC